LQTILSYLYGDEFLSRLVHSLEDLAEGAPPQGLLKLKQVASVLKKPYLVTGFGFESMAE